LTRTASQKPIDAAIQKFKNAFSSEERALKWFSREWEVKKGVFERNAYLHVKQPSILHRCGTL
jgi:hypothetical protein